MRLVCPECDSRYEVEEALLPAPGRDVQCSACGAAWFQERAGIAPPDAGAEEDIPALSDPGAAPPPRTVSGAALDILREEAEFEARRRAQEAGMPPPTLSQTVAQAGGPNPIPAPNPDPTPRPSASKPAASVRDLSGTQDRPAEETAPEPRARRVFLRGFALPFVLIAIAALPYLLAPGLIQGLPEAEGLITAYVAAVDRVWAALSEAAQGMAEQLDAVPVLRDMLAQDR